MLNSWFEACKNLRVHCRACREDARWRQSLLNAGVVAERDFECPYGVTAETAPAIQAEAMSKLPQPNPSFDQITEEAKAKAKAQLEEQGRTAWAWLHERCRDRTLTTERLAGEFLPMVPKYGCGCYNDAVAYIKDHPLPADPKDQPQWASDWHDAVNAKLGKPLWKPQ